MKRNIKLYNLIFPIWLIWLIPTTWLLVLPANFLIDLIIIVCTCKYLKIGDIKKHAKSVILKTWIFGFIADFISTALMLLSNIIDFDITTPLGAWWQQNITHAVAYSPFSSVFSVLWIAICVGITALFIFRFNYKICLKN